MHRGRDVSEPPQKDDRYSTLRTTGMMFAIPMLLIVSPLVGFFLGSLVDRWLKSSPWFAILGLFLGFAAGGRETYLIYRRTLAREERDKRP